MKMKIAIALLTVPFCLSAVAADAGTYVSAGLGVNVNNSRTEYDSGRKDKYDNAAFYTAAVGYDVPVLPVRAEIEGLYSRSDLQESARGKMTTYGTAANVYVKIPVVGLYAGAGAGYASIRHEHAPFYQGMIGVEYGLFGLNLGLEARHIQSDGAIKSERERTFFRSDVLMLKARYEF